MITEQFQASGPVRIVVHQGIGPVELVAAAVEGVDVRIDGPDADDYSVDFTADTLTIQAPPVVAKVFRKAGAAISGGTAVSIAAPVGSQLDIEVGSGAVDIRGEFGPGAVHTGAGNLDIEQVSADMRVETGAGNVTLSTVSAKARVHLGAGNTRVSELSGDLTVATGAGNLHVARAVRGSLAFESAAGSATIGVPAGTPTWTKLSTLMGHVNSSLPPVGEPPEGADHLELHIQTVTGNITLQPAIC